MGFVANKLVLGQVSYKYFGLLFKSLIPPKAAYLSVAWGWYSRLVTK
jgi:hypothetical protein